MATTIQIPKEEYQDMLDYMERMRETIDVLSNKELVKKLKSALSPTDKVVSRIHFKLKGLFAPV